MNACSVEWWLVWCVAQLVTAVGPMGLLLRRVDWSSAELLGRAVLLRLGNPNMAASSDAAG